MKKKPQALSNISYLYKQDHIVKCIKIHQKNWMSWRIHEWLSYPLNKYH